MESINSAMKGLHLKDAACYQEAAVYQIRALECETNPKTKRHLSCRDTMAVFVAKPAVGSEPGRREKGDGEDPIQVKYHPALYFNAITAVEGVRSHTNCLQSCVFFFFLPAPSS